ncbi:MAG: hypothetical protein AAFN68_04145 [Pseudomonadota bacterium]
MKSVQAYMNVFAAIAINQSASEQAEQPAERARCGECNYNDNYYGDQVCMGPE